tara:strand:- start:858 stop:1634 length:777 start_codon:yes stop_codon:yes gene_type:complete
MTGSLVKIPDLEAVASFQKTQYAFASHLRDPQVNPAPEGIEDRRMKIYRDLVYNNIESFISSGFPILRSLMNDDCWHKMVRDFVSHHQSHTPYFLEITQEFLRYLQEERAENVDDLPFMLELAHYEWVELALDVSSQEIPNTDTRVEDILSSKPEVSPLAWRLSYQYPVHRLGSGDYPQEQSEDPTFLVVYRNRAHEVKFLEANAVTLHLLQLFEDQTISVHDALAMIAEQLGLDSPDTVFKNGKDLVTQLYSLEILI